MHVFSPLDRLFTVVIALVIAFSGLALWIASGRWQAIVFSLTMLGIYLFFALRRPSRRRRSLQTPFPREWRQALKRDSVFYCNLTPEAQLRFEQDIRLFLSEFSIKGRGLEEVSPDIHLAIASAVAMMLHGRPDWDPPIPDGVVVYPGQVFNRKYKSHAGNYTGMATPNAPLLLTEGGLAHSRRFPHDGYNVIIHELAHYFDTHFVSPALKAFIRCEWARGRSANRFLDIYAMTNESEFFAVSVENFFERPWLVKAGNIELYEALQEFFNLDSASLIPAPEKFAEAPSEIDTEDGSVYMDNGEITRTPSAPDHANDS